MRDCFFHDMKRLTNFILLFCLVGLVVAGISLYYHFADAGESFCNINDRFNCQTVYQSEYSYLFGIPVPVLGIIAYLGFAGLIIFQRQISSFLVFSMKEYWWYLSVIASIMLTYQLIMTSISSFVIGAICVLCLISQASILVIATLSWINWRSQ